MQVFLEKKAIKKLERTNEPLKSRIINALRGLGKYPPQGDNKSLHGREDYRLRVGGYRVLYRIETDTVVVTNIAPRGQVYKENQT
jgi:mRNA interferase RelE/StbE